MDTSIINHNKNMLYKYNLYRIMFRDIVRVDPPTRTERAVKMCFRFMLIGDKGFNIFIIYNTKKENMLRVR